MPRHCKCRNKSKCECDVNSAQFNFTIGPFVCPPTDMILTELPFQGPKSISNENNNNNNNNIENKVNNNGDHGKEKCCCRKKCKCVPFSPITPVPSDGFCFAKAIFNPPTICDNTCNIILNPNDNKEILIHRTGVYRFHYHTILRFTNLGAIQLGYRALVIFNGNNAPGDARFFDVVFQQFPPLTPFTYPIASFEFVISQPNTTVSFAINTFNFAITTEQSVFEVIRLRDIK